MIAIEWRPVPGYEGLYDISSDGQVRRSGKSRSPNQRSIQNQVGHVLKPKLSTGYPRLELCNEGVVKSHSVHSLVAKAFLGERPKDQQVNHRNGVKTDNRVENLEYLTCRENILHARRVLRIGIGEAVRTTKLDVGSVRTIRARSASGESLASIARDFSVARQTIRKVVTRQTWKHVS